MPPTPPSPSFLRSLPLAKKYLRPQDLVLGCIWLGPGSGSGIHGNGTHPDLGQDNATSLVRAAVAAGITEFDTAPWYGAGASEERLGRAIRQAQVMKRVSVGTKAGRIFWESDGKTPAGPGFDDDPKRDLLSTRICTNDYTAQGTRTSMFQSLLRLGMFRVPTLRIHDPNDNSNNNRHSSPDFVDEVAQALAPGGMVEELRAMRERGEVAKVGIGMNTNNEGAPEDVLRLLKGAPDKTFDSALLAGGWNLLSQSGWECLQECQKRQVEVHAAGIFASGFLADKSKSYAYQDNVPNRVQRKRQEWLDFAGRYSLPAVAVGFAALPNVVTRLVVGVATPDELQQVLEWVEESNSIPLSFWMEAAEAGLWRVDEEE